MLTLIAGRFRGRRLKLPLAKITRPTAQRTRAAIFNILAHNPHFPLTNARVLDVFAGSGAMGLEALSRGAAHITFIEHHPQVIQTLKDNIHMLGIESACTLIPVPVQRLPQTAQPADLVFIDPPYKENLETPTLEILYQRGWLHPQTLILIETAAASSWQAPSPFEVLDERHYGTARVSFLKLIAPSL